MPANDDAAGLADAVRAGIDALDRACARRDRRRLGLYRADLDTIRSALDTGKSSYEVLRAGERPEPTHKARTRQRVRALRLGPRDERRREALGKVSGRRHELTAHALAYRRPLVADDELEDLVDIQPRSVRLGIGDSTTSSCSCARDGRSSRSPRAWVQ